MSMPSEHLRLLHATLGRRDTPETVLALIHAALPEVRRGRFSERIRTILTGSSERRFGWSSMSRRFRPPDGPERQIAKARELAHAFLGADLPEGADADALEAVAQALNQLIGKTYGRSNFARDRLDGAARDEQGLGLSRRRHGKLFRLAGRLEDRARRLRREEERAGLILVSKEALAPRLTIEDFDGDLHGAAFVAYYAARMKLRSAFTISGQQRPFDENAAHLLKLCEREPGTSWWAIAHVFPRADVLARLTDDQKGRLLGQWFDILQITAERLAEAWSRTDIDLDSMVVRRGNDSSTWNLLAGAFNRARDHWIALVEAMGAEALLEAMMPGKVLRLMAADVAAWHRREGGGVHPDTRVWARLPRPWAVLRGEAECTRTAIEAACVLERIDPVRSGWSAARPRTQVAAFQPTAELVHGVAVNNPYLARYFRDAGVFSGRPLKSAKL